VAHQVQKLKHTEGSEDAVMNCVGGPARRGVVRVEQEVVAAEAHENPVVRTVLEDIEERHSVSAESVHKESLQLTLNIMAYAHGNTQLLTKVVLRSSAIDLFLEDNEEHRNTDWTEVLDEEDSGPAYLSSKVLEDESDLLGQFFLGKEITEQCSFVRHGFTLGVSNGESHSVDVEVLLLEVGALTDDVAKQLTDGH